MIILIDMDEILADLITSVNKYYNKLHGTNFKREDYKTCNWWEVWGCSYEEADRICHEFMMSPAARKIKPIPGSVEAIEILKQTHKLVVATARKSIYTTITIDWLTELHGDDAFRGIYLLNKYGEGHKMLKSELAKELSLTLADSVLSIDDQIECAIDYSKAGIPCLVFKSPWNENAVLPNLATSVSSWEEILNECYIRTQIMK